MSFITGVLLGLGFFVGLIIGIVIISILFGWMLRGLLRKKNSSAS